MSKYINIRKQESKIKLDISENTIYDSSNTSTNYPINILHTIQMNESANSEKSNKLNINIFIILVINIILILKGIYLFVYKRGNYRIIKYYNNDNSMKHAILLLSSYGINYMNNALSQFNNDKRFDIFIHIDGKSKIDIENNKFPFKFIFFIKNNEYYLEYL